jgi:hypothetical protein
MFPSLADLSLKYLNKDISKDKKGDDIWRLKYGTLDGVPFSDWPKEALEYALHDAELTYQVFMAQGGLQKVQPTEAMQVQAAVVLQAIGVWGFAINPDKREVIRSKLEAKAQDLRSKIDKYGWTGEGSQARMQEVVRCAWQNKHMHLMMINASVTGVLLKPEEFVPFIGTQDIRTCLQKSIESGQPIPGLYYSRLTDWRTWCSEMVKQLPEAPVTKKGYSTAGETLEQLQDTMPQFQDYLELRHVEKMLKNYVEPYSNATVHPRFVPLVSTGRTGCREPNTQNIPRKDKTRPDEAFRTMFRARPGRILGTVDYSQLELCTLAATIRTMFPGINCTLGDAIDQGKDVHCITGGLISGLSYEQMLAGKAAKDEKVLNYRQGAKACNFGLPGGLGGGAFVGYAKASYGVIISLKQSWQYINAWKKAWPEVSTAYLKYSANAVDENNGHFTAYTITDRPKAHCSYTEGSNYPFQGLAADGAKAALWAIWREMMLGWYWRTHLDLSGYGVECRESPLCSSNLVNFVHDEVVAEHPEGDAGKAALKRQESLMISEMTRICQNKITISVEGKLSDAWEH